MDQITERLYFTAPLEKDDFEQLSEKKLNDISNLIPLSTTLKK